MTMTDPEQQPTISSPPATPTVSMRNPFRSTGTTSGPVARWVLAGGAFVGTVGIGAYMYLIDPNNPANAYPKCPLKLITGIDCPGCGGLRATHSLLHGDIMGALDHNVLALIIVPFMLYGLLRLVLGQFDKQLPPIPTRRFMSWAVPVFVLVFTIVRNIPVGPFAYLGSA
jgi:hypothetical protein